ncbi:MAG: shikimate dehydrogenase [Candidatus Tokpelaia sp. JSC189]|nr:MAG: shikimate dehydrogenase [Candidatus Tokpelaia sp. JSC189]
MSKIPKAFVTGYPIHQSRSPQIHSYWLDFYRISGSYDPVEITGEHFPFFIHSLKERGFSGGNVTLPYKEQAYALAEKCDEVASHIGAVNTLWFENGILHGGNTDAYGFACNLDDFAPGWEKDTALVIGAGGASRAVLFALKERGYQKIILINRTRGRADYLAQHFGRQIVVANWQSINNYIGEAELIVNTTSLGMKNHIHDQDENQQPVINFAAAKPDVVVTDLVYTPLMTPFLKQAQKTGLKTVDGIGMLLHQATLGFEHWFGIKPQVTKALRSQILTGMGEKEI